MTEIELRFDNYLPYANSDILKSAVKLWGGRGSERKDAYIDIISAGLSTPQRVRWAIEKLTPFEHTALTASRRRPRWRLACAPAALRSPNRAATPATRPVS